MNLVSLEIGRHILLMHRLICWRLFAPVSETIDQNIGEFQAVRNRRATDFDTPKL